jgi:hypothetical protein
MTRTCLTTFSGGYSSPIQSNPNHEHVEVQSFAIIGPHAEFQAANGSGTPPTPQYRVTLTRDFARRRDLGANSIVTAVDGDDTDCAARAALSRESTRQTHQRRY